MKTKHSEIDYGSMTYTELYMCRALEFGGFGKQVGEAKYSVIGVPFDFTSTYRPGSRLGPGAIREASQNLESYCLRKRLDVEDVGIEDLGDLSILSDVEGTLERLRRVICEVFARGRLPIVLGGEHTITYGCIHALGDAAILSFDAHLDLRDEYMGRRLSHATFMRRLCEEVGSDKLYEVGVRALSREELEFAENNEVKYTTALDILKDGEDAKNRVLSWVSRFERVYITVDIDVLDPAYAPGVGNPVPEGLSPTHVIDILEEACTPRLVGMDVVEVAPQYDAGLSAIQASNIIYNAIAFLEAAGWQAQGK